MSNDPRLLEDILGQLRQRNDQVITLISEVRTLFGNVDKLSDSIQATDGLFARIIRLEERLSDVSKDMEKIYGRLYDEGVLEELASNRSKIELEFKNVFHELSGLQKKIDACVKAEDPVIGSLEKLRQAMIDNPSLDAIIGELKGSREEQSHGQEAQQHGNKISIIFGVIGTLLAIAAVIYSIISR